MRPSATPISRRSTDKRRLAVSRTLPRLSMHPSIAVATPENSPTPARSPPSRGNCSPTRDSQRSRLPRACKVSAVSASSSGSSMAPIWRGERAAGCRAVHRREDRAQSRWPRPSRSSAPGVGALRPGRSRAPCSVPPACPANRRRARPRARILSNSSRSSVWASISPRSEQAAGRPRAAAPRSLDGKSRFARVADTIASSPVRNHTRPGQDLSLDVALT